MLAAEKSREEATSLAERATALEKEERSAVLEVQDKQALAEAARLTLVRARFHLLQVCTLLLSLRRNLLDKFSKPAAHIGAHLARGWKAMPVEKGIEALHGIWTRLL